MRTPSLRALRAAAPTPSQGAIPAARRSRLRGSLVDGGGWSLGSRATVLAFAAGLAGCAAGVGVGIPLVPGVSLGLGVGPGGPSVGLGTGFGPLGTGVSVNSSGQVHGNAGVGIGAGSSARVGTGVGTSTMLYDPDTPRPAAMPAPSSPPPPPTFGVERGSVKPSPAYSAADISNAPRAARPTGGGPPQSDSPY